MKAHLGDACAPDPKSDSKILIDFFTTVLPGYDAERFYPSHMKKVVLWYNQLKEFASLDFTEAEEEKEQE